MIEQPPLIDSAETLTTKILITLTSNNTQDSSYRYNPKVVAWEYFSLSKNDWVQDSKNKVFKNFLKQLVPDVKAMKSPSAFLVQLASDLDDKKLIDSRTQEILTELQKFVSM